MGSKQKNIPAPNVSDTLFNIVRSIAEAVFKPHYSDRMKRRIIELRGRL